jgi:1,4-dihydroxy-2-naphthoyl-CoA hydrolase
MGARADMAYLPLETTFMGVLQPEFHDSDAGDLCCTVAVRDDLKQPMGIVHGGIYAAISETVASMGSAIAVGLNENPEANLAVMGQANNTSFLRPVTEGSIHAVGTIRHRGRTTIVWQVDMRDDAGRLCATSQVTIAVRERRP